MPGTPGGKPKPKPPARRQVGRERVVRPKPTPSHAPNDWIRGPEHWVSAPPSRQSAADLLKGTVKGGGGGTGVAGPGGTVISGGTPVINGGHSVQDAILHPKPPKPTAADRPLSANLNDVATMINGGKPLTAESYAGWTAAQKYDYAEASLALRANQALGGLPLALNENLSAFASQFTQAVQTLNAQVHVGGTKGTAKPVDRSAAVRLAWATRRKLYGTSGTKD